MTYIKIIEIVVIFQAVNNNQFNQHESQLERKHLLTMQTLIAIVYGLQIKIYFAFKPEWINVHEASAVINESTFQAVTEAYSCRWHMCIDAIQGQFRDAQAHSFNAHQTQLTDWLNDLSLQIYHTSGLTLNERLNHEKHTSLDEYGARTEESQSKIDTAITWANEQIASINKRSQAVFPLQWRENRKKITVLSKPQVES